MGRFSKNKHLIKLAILCSIVILIALVYMFFKMDYIPIFGKIIAAKQMSNYANTQIINLEFDWINGKYVSTLDNGCNLSYRLQSNTIHDEHMSIEINDIANNKYQSIRKEFPSNLVLPENISVWTSLNAYNYTIKSQRIYFLGIYNTDSLTQEESLKMPANIAQTFIKLMGKEYNFTGIQLIYADRNGMYEISISADTFNTLEYQRLFKNTRKYSKQELPLDYVEWLEQQSK